MSKIYKKKDENTLIITRTVNETHIIEETRTEIQTQIDHAEFDKSELLKKIDTLTAKIAILDS